MRLSALFIGGSLCATSPTPPQRHTGAEGTRYEIQSIEVGSDAEMSAIEVGQRVRAVVAVVE